MYSILLFDANASFSTTFANLLRNSGYSVETAHSIEVAKTLHEGHSFDLIVLGIDGSNPLDLSQSDFADTKMLLLLSSGESTPPVPVSWPEHTRVFHKPFRTEAVLAAIYETLVSAPAP